MLEATAFFCKYLWLLSSLSQPGLAVKAVDPYVAQDVVSCLYHIQNIYGSSLAALENPAGNAAIVGIGTSLLAILRVSLKSKICHRPYSCVSRFILPSLRPDRDQDACCTGGEM